MMTVNGTEIVEHDAEWGVKDRDGDIIDLDSQEEAEMYAEAYGGILVKRIAYLTDWYAPG